jgi:nitronate monooxygenase
MFLCSGVALAAESCKAGLIGTLTRNHLRDTAELESELQAVSAALQAAREADPARPIAPLAVNISQRFPIDEMRAQLALCRRFAVEIIITASGDPSWCAPLIRDAGLLHYHDATSVRFAEKAIAAGVDGIIAIGAGGGGHSGGISHLALIPEIRARFDGTIVLAGAVSTGATIRAAEVLGADLVYLGTRFIATRESKAPDAYKSMLVQATAADVLYTDAVNGVPANWLKPSLVANGLDPANLPRPVTRGADHLPPEVKPWVNLWSAGHGVSLIHDVPPVAELARRLQREYLSACAIPDMASAARTALMKDTGHV